MLENFIFSLQSLMKLQNYLPSTFFYTFTMFSRIEPWNDFGFFCFSRLTNIWNQMLYVSILIAFYFIQFIFVELLI